MTPLKPDYTPGAIEQRAGKLAEMFTMDANDLKKAYAGKPDSLESHFNAASGAKAEYSKYLTRTVVSGVVGLVFWPVLLYTGYAAIKAHDNHVKFHGVGDALKSEVAVSKKAPAPETPFIAPAPPA